MNGKHNINILSLMEEYLLEDIAAVREHYPSIDDETFDKLIRLDPTFKENVDRVGTYGKWLLDLYKKTNQIPDENIKEILLTFDKNKNHLPIDKRDINKYKSIEDLQNMLNSTEIELSQNQIAKQNRREKHKANLVQDADYLGRFGNYDIYIPKTYAASCKLGSGTTWCTASTSGDNYFNSYNSRGNLYILINSNNPNEKYQIHFESNSFMNKDDENVSSKELSRVLKDSPEIYTEFIVKYGDGGKVDSRITHVYNRIKNGEAVDINYDDYSSLIIALADYFEVSPDEVIETDRDNYYEIEQKGLFLVLSDRDADDEFEASVKNLIDEVGIDETFGESINLENYIDESEGWQEMYDFYYNTFYDDYQYEKEYILERMYEDGILSDDDFDEVDEDGEPIFESCNKDEDELAELYANNEADKEDYLDWLKGMGYSGIELTEHLGNALNLDSLIEDLKEMYGRGNELARYDGYEHEIGEVNGEEYFAYKIDDYS